MKYLGTFAGKTIMNPSLGLVLPFEAPYLSVTTILPVTDYRLKHPYWESRVVNQKSKPQQDE